MSLISCCKACYTSNVVARPLCLIFGVGVDKTVDSAPAAEVIGMILSVLLIGFGGALLIIWTLRRRRYKQYSAMNIGSNDHTEEEEANDPAQSQPASGGV